MINIKKILIKNILYKKYYKYQRHDFLLMKILLRLNVIRETARIVGVIKIPHVEQQLNMHQNVANII